MATIQGVYVALFGRPADPAGLAYFNGVTQSGANLNGIGDLSSTKEYKDRFAGLNNVQIVTAIYQSLFNRDPEAAGLNFFVNALNNKTLSINNIAIAILDGAQGTDKTVVDAKVASANAFTAAIDTPVEVGQYVGNAAAAQGRAFLADVSTTAKTSAQADAAILQLGVVVNVGNTVTLTAGNENIVVGALAATNTLNVSTDRDDTINATTVDFLNNGDKIDGGFGVDTVNATLDASGFAPAAGEVKNVEIFNFKSTTAAVVDATNIAGETQVWNDASTTALTVNNITLGAAVGLNGTIGAATTYTFAAATGNADAATLVTKAAVVTGGVSIAAIESLTINNTGTSTLGTVTAADATSLSITGSGSLSFTLAAANAATITNSSTGTVTTDVSALDKLATYNGGTGIDVITTNTAGLAQNQTVNGGAGVDTITVNGNGATGFTLTVNGGAASDLFNIGTGTVLANIGAIATAADLVKSLVTIADFNKAEDSITYNGGERITLTNGQLGNITGQADLLAAVTAAQGFLNASASATDDTAVFTFGGNTYIYTDVNVNGALNVGDSLVQITGIASTDLTATTFSFV